jgi:nucleotide-binding universal stress UspA family protein
VRIGHPATEIVREAEDGNYDLVIVGEGSNRHLMRRVLLGSTVIRVVEHAPCPVIVAKGKIDPIRRVLLCDSGSRDPSVGLPSASPPSAAIGKSEAGPSVLSRFVELPIDLLDGTGEMVVLHVMSQISAGPGVNGEHLRNSAERLIVERAPEGELLQRDIAALEAIGIHARAKVRHGLVVDEILQEVRGQDYDLVVIGAYRGVGWQRILLDDLAHRLVVELDRPVLVVR